jgi:hypothetical protein
MNHAPHYLRFARAIALVSGISTPFVAIVACSAGTGTPAGVDGGSHPPTPTGVAEMPEGAATGVARGPDDGSTPYDGFVVGVAPHDSGPGGGGPQAIPELPESWSRPANEAILSA